MDAVPSCHSASLFTSRPGRRIPAGTPDMVRRGPYMSRGSHEAVMGWQVSAGGCAFSVKSRGGIDEALCPTNRVPSVSGLSLLSFHLLFPRVIIPSCLLPPFSPFPPSCPLRPPTVNPSRLTSPAHGPAPLAISTTTLLKMQTSPRSPRTPAARESVGPARTVVRLAGDGRIPALSAHTTLQSLLLALPVPTLCRSVRPSQTT